MEPKSCYRVCSDHFIGEKTETNPDPVLNLGHFRKRSNTDTERNDRYRKRSTKKMELSHTTLSCEYTAELYIGDFASATDSHTDSGSPGSYAIAAQFVVFFFIKLEKKIQTTYSAVK